MIVHSPFINNDRVGQSYGSFFADFAKTKGRVQKPPAQKLSVEGIGQNPPFSAKKFPFLETDCPLGGGTPLFR